MYQIGQRTCSSAVIMYHNPINRATIMEKPSTKSRLATADRYKIVYMWIGGKPAREISLEVGVSLATVYRWIRVWKREGSTRRPDGGGLFRTHWEDGAELIIPQHLGTSGWDPYFPHAHVKSLSENYFI